MRKIHYSLPYGRSHVRLTLPESWNHRNLSPSYAPVPEPTSRVMEALEHPIEAPALRNFLRPNDRILILVTDPTRKVRYDILLPPLIQIIRESLPSQVEFLVATGTHKPPLQRVLKEHLGKTIVQNSLIHIHNCRDFSRLKFLGKSEAGTPIYLNSLLFEFDKILVTGSITFHYYAGFTGGPKMIMPGVAGYETIQANHKRVLQPLPGRGKAPKADAGILDGNPVYEDIRDIVQIYRAMPGAALLFSIASVLGDTGEMIGVFAGDLEKAHKAGCEFVQKRFSVKIDKPFDLVIASAGGFPYDFTYYQAHKALEHASRAVRDGGCILFVSSLDGGPGEGILRWMRWTHPETLEELMRDHYDHTAHIAYCHFLKLQRAQIVLLSRLPAETAGKMHFLPAKNMEEALAFSAEGFTQPPETCIISNASLTLPVSSL